jgi:hypothetical protein
MELVNGTNLPVAWTVGFERDGRELIVVIVKATYQFPHANEEPVLAENQVPLTEADEFTGEPGLSATRYETDYAHRKPMCDVLVNGSAYAPHGAPATKVAVGLRVGRIRKRFDVLGNRVWDKVLLSFLPSPPEPFVKLPITYDRAYGGADCVPENAEITKTYLDNPVGIGYYPLSKNRALIGKPLANTCETGRPAIETQGKYRPMSFGPVSRNIRDRIKYAGTYDEAWLEDQMPFWPKDFDYRFFQSAPSDQQIPYLQGGEEVEIENLSAEGFTHFRIPKFSMPVVFAPHRGQEQKVTAACDTLVIEPDKNCFMLTWRAPFGLRRNLLELKEVIVGEMPRSWRTARRSRITGKRHYASIEELIQAKRRR